MKGAQGYLSSPSGARPVAGRAPAGRTAILLPVGGSRNLIEDCCRFSTKCLACVQAGFPPPSLARRPPHPMPPKRSYVVSRADQLRALRSPLRQEIIDAVAASGPRSVAELAEILGRPADALY